MKTPMEQWHRRHAIMLAGQLLENVTDALLVIEAIRELVEKFLTPAGATTDNLAANALAFKGRAAGQLICD